MDLSLDLPTEILERIFMLLYNTHTLKKAKVVCKRWNLCIHMLQSEWIRVLLSRNDTVHPQAFPSPSILTKVLLLRNDNGYNVLKHRMYNYSLTVG